MADDNMWKCPKCGKKVDDDFEICWACGTSMDGVENPDFLDESNVGKTEPGSLPEQVPPESLVTLIKCSLPPEAHAIRVRLENEGIPVYLFDEFTITMDWLLSNAIGGVKVQVPEPYLAQARALLGLDDEEQDEDLDNDDNDDDGDEGFGEATDGALEQGIVDLEKSSPISGDDGIIDKQDGGQ